jgi:hypothetical protein
MQSNKAGMLYSCMAQIEIDLMLQRLPAFFRGNKNGFKK